MAKFKLDEFEKAFDEAPSVNLIEHLRKTDIAQILTQLKVPFQIVSRKNVLKETLLEYYVDEEILDESVLTVDSAGLSSSDLKEIQLEKLRLESEARLGKLKLELMLGSEKRK